MGRERLEAKPNTSENPKRHFRWFQRRRAKDGTARIDDNDQAARIRERLRTDPGFLPRHQDLQTAFVLPGYEQKGLYYWVDFVNDGASPVFEMWTEEYIDAFSTYLRTRLDEFGASIENPLTILEVGAGNGKLAHSLRERLGVKAADRFRIVVTDIKPWEAESEVNAKKAPQVYVEKLGYVEALKKYEPDIVISSWMPREADWTGAFRQTPSVKEYILIGIPSRTADSAAWGRGSDGRFIPDYSIDGFRRIELSDVNKYQICGMDAPHISYSYSVTAAFRRKV